MIVYHIADSINVSAAVLSDTSFRVSWNIPTTITSQGLSAFTIVVTPECLTGAQVGGTQRFNPRLESVTSVDIGNLGMPVVRLPLLYICTLLFFVVFRIICSLPCDYDRYDLPDFSDPLQ